MTIIVIGNGESRANINLFDIKNKTIGCNAIIRDYPVDCLVCVDRRMVKEAIDLNYQQKIYTRKDWISQFSNNNQVQELPLLPFPNKKTKADDPFNWGSGPYAVLLGAYSDNEIKLIGFDLFSESSTVNNIYKGTKNYDPIGHKAIDPRFWIYQIKQIFSLFKNHKFILYQKNTWSIPKQWILPNVSLDNIDNFKYN